MTLKTMKNITTPIISGKYPAKTQNNKITLLSTITFFVTRTTSSMTKADLLAFAKLLYTITDHILRLINVIISQNKSTMFSSTTPLTNDSQFSDRSLNLSAYVIATNEKFTFKLFNKANVTKQMSRM